MVTGFVARSKALRLIRDRLPPGTEVSSSLKVIDTENLTNDQAEASIYNKTVYINREDPKIGPFLDELCFITCTKDGDFILQAKPHTDVPVGCIALSESQRINLRVGTSSVLDFHVFCPPEECELASVLLEVRYLPGYEPDEENGEEAILDAQQLSKYVGTKFFHSFLTVNERIVAQVSPGVYVVLRVAEVESMNQDDEDNPLTEHFYRGVLTPETQIYVTKEPLTKRALSEETERADFELINVREKAAASTPAKTVKIMCNDEEWFPVKKALLKPCISLTKMVRDKDAEVQTVTVDIGCLLFDKILIYLEAEARGEADKFQMDINQVEEYLDAAKKLGLRGLEEMAQKMMGDFESRIRYYSYEELMANVKQGICWLVIDGMICDVTRWLPEHPGGSVIIPTQALGVDATVFFELYHASRESFMYLKQFYIGEIKPDDLHKIPKPEHGEASADFHEQLREYTTFRLTHRVVNHLGAR